MSSITLEGLTKEFGDLVAVKDVDLEVEDEEFLVLVGPSGCGKSTLLRMIAGLETATRGDLRLDDERVNDVEPADRDVAMVFQNYALYPHMSARRNMTFGVKSKRSFTDEEIDRRVTEAADILGISDLLDRKPAELSGGEQQRVAMGRALLRDPEVFLLDEPLSNLDAKLRDQMRTELTKLHDELRTTTVYVTHDQTEAMTLGDRIAVMNAGEIQQVASPQDVYEYPANRFVAQFIGSPRMNIMPAVVTNSDGTYYAEPEVGRLELHDDPALADLDQFETLELGVRPEDIHVAGGTEGTSEPFEVEVTMMEPLGDSLVVYADMGGEQIQFQTKPRQPFDVGDAISVAVDLNRLHLFDADTGTVAYHSDPDKTTPRSRPTVAR